MFALGCAGNIVPIEREGGSRKWIGTALGAEALKVLNRIKTTENAPLYVASATVELPLKPLSTNKQSQPSQHELTETQQTTITTEVQAIRIGELIILGLPGEVFVEIGLAIKIKADINRPVFVISLCNDALAYLPIAEAYDEGGYEPEWTKLARGAGEKLLQSALDLLQAI